MHPEQGLPMHHEQSMPLHPERGVPPHPERGMPPHPERGMPPHPERGSTSAQSEAVPLSRARRYLYPERGTTSAQSGALPLHRAGRTGKFDFTDTIRFAVRPSLRNANLYKTILGFVGVHPVRESTSAQSEAACCNSAIPLNLPYNGGGYSPDRHPDELHPRCQQCVRLWSLLPS